MPEALCPLAVLPPLATNLILSFLAPRDLARACAVSQAWREKAADVVLWRNHCEALWAGKVWVASAIRELAHTQPMAAYGRSLTDSARDVPTESELCGFTWNLSFKFIPWFSAALGSLTVRRYFQTNHTLTAPPSDPLWGDSEPQRHYWYFRDAPDAAAAAAAAGMDDADEDGGGGEGHAGGGVVGGDGAAGLFPPAAAAPPPQPLTLLQVNTYPALTCRRTPDWGWELQNAMVRLTIDTAAGPNPGLPPDHPAARETMTLEQVRARFDALLSLQALEDSSEAEEEEEEREEDDSSSSTSSSEPEEADEQQDQDESGYEEDSEEEQQEEDPGKND